MRANNDNRSEALLAVIDAVTAERVVRLAFPVIQEDFFADVSCAVWHIKELLSLYNGHLQLDSGYRKK